MQTVWTVVDFDVKYRQAIETILISTLVLAPVLLGSRPPWAMAFDGILISLMVGMWLLRTSRKGALKLRRTPLDQPILGLLGLSVLSTFTSIYPYASMVETARFASYALVYYIIVNNLTDRFSTRRVLIALVLLGAILSAYGIYEVVSGSEKVLWVDKPVFRGSVGAVTGTYWNRNHFGGFLILVFPLGVGMALYEARRRLWRGAAFYSVLSVAILAGLIGTFSRASWIGTLAALALMSLLALLSYPLPRSYKLGVLAGAIALALLIAGVAPWKVVNRFLSTFEANDPSKAFRYQVFLSSLQMIRDRPFLGFGPGTFQFAWRAYRLPNPKSLSDAVHAHNEYAQFGAEMGILAPLLIVVLLIQHVRRGIRSISASSPSMGEGKGGVAQTDQMDQLTRQTQLDRADRVDWVAAALVAAPTGLAVANFFDFHWRIPATALLFWVLLGLARTWQST